MRARQLKPGIFKNEKLGSADPLLTILFEGLWCMADRAGRLEDRPLRMCAEVFPYRRGITAKRVEKLVDWLEAEEFVARYEVGGKHFLQVLNFSRHQNPHTDEKQSIIPPLTPKSHRAGIGEAPGEPDKSPELVGLTPDSGLLTPDSPLRGRARAQPLTPGKPEGNGVRSGPIDAGDRLTQQSADDSSGLDAWRDAGCDPEAMQTWLAHLEQLSPPKALSGASRIHAAQILRGMGDADTQRRAVQTAAANGWKSLRHGDGKQAAAASPAKRMRTAQEIAAQYPEEVA